MDVGKQERRCARVGELWCGVREEGGGRGCMYSVVMTIGATVYVAPQNLGIYNLLTLSVHDVDGGNGGGKEGYLR